MYIPFNSKPTRNSKVLNCAVVVLVLFIGNIDAKSLSSSSIMFPEDR